MQATHLRIVVSLCAILLASCASAPKPMTTALAATATVAANPAPAAATLTVEPGTTSGVAAVVGTVPAPLAPTATATNAKTTVAMKALNMELLARGYRAKRKNGTILYCVNETPTGSNIRSDVCMTEERVLAQQAAARAFQQEMEDERLRRCPGGRCRR